MALIDKETIRAEIERRYNATIGRLQEGNYILRKERDFDNGKAKAYAIILSFLDTLSEQEHPIYKLNQILLDWVREAKTDKEHEARFDAHKRVFELYDEYMEQEPEQPVEGPLDGHRDRKVFP